MSQIVNKKNINHSLPNPISHNLNINKIKTKQRNEKGNFKKHQKGAKYKIK